MGDGSAGRGAARRQLEALGQQLQIAATACGRGGSHVLALASGTDVNNPAQSLGSPRAVADGGRWEDAWGSRMRLLANDAETRR